MWKTVLDDFRNRTYRTQTVIAYDITQYVCGGVDLRGTVGGKRKYNRKRDTLITYMIPTYFSSPYIHRYKFIVYRRVKPVLNVLLLYCRRHRCGRGEHHFRMYGVGLRDVVVLVFAKKPVAIPKDMIYLYTHIRRVMEGVVMIPCYTDVQGAPKMCFKKWYLF